MKKTTQAVITIAAMALAFAAGAGYGRFGRRGAEKPAARRVLYYVDPMHPAYRSDKPGTAPDCGMKLEPVYEEAPAAPAAFAADDTIHISAEKQRLIGVRYGAAEFAPGVGAFRTTGRITADETRIVRVHARVDGWIEEVFADFTGKAVEKGAPLLTLYSPELLATQQEYLLALKSKDIMKESALHSAMEHADTLLEAARKRLELWDLGEAQIGALAATRKPVRNVTLYAPAGGHILSRDAFPRQRVTPETELYVIADLGKVWIIADVFESEAARVRTGQKAAITLPFGRRVLEASVSHIQPQVDPETRTLKVRLEAENPGFALKPDMFVDVELRTSAPGRVTVPAEAVLDTGLRQTVFVDRGGGALETRQVETGERSGGRIEIVKGLKAGERVVTSGNFLVDSESQLKGGGGHDKPHH
jgi:RND family efflux transporter MFP subunit